MAVKADIEDKTLGEVLLEITLFNMAAEQGGLEPLMVVKTTGNYDTCLRLTPSTMARLTHGLIEVLQEQEKSVAATQTEAIN